MRKPLMAALASVLIVVSHGFAGAQRADDPQPDIQAVYNRMSAATVSAKTYADAEAIHKWLDTPDCTFTNFMQAARTWAQMRSEIEASLATPLSGLSSVIRKLEVTSSAAAIATTVVEGKARIVDEAGQYGAKGASHDIVTRATVRDVWLKAPDGWRRQSHEKLTPTGVATVDGKPPTFTPRRSQG